jgi:hypothetical protein
MVLLYPQIALDRRFGDMKLVCWLSRRQGLEKEAGLRRIPLQPAVCIYYNEINIKKSKK